MTGFYSSTEEKLMSEEDQLKSSVHISIIPDLFRLIFSSSVELIHWYMQKVLKEIIINII